MAIKKAPFNIPAINNHFEALAKTLGISDDNDQERSKIEALGDLGGISKFKYNGDEYSVARIALLPDVKTAVQFNSGWYAIQKVGVDPTSA